MDCRQRITIEPEKGSGKPCIRGLRFTGGDVLSHLASGVTEAVILADFPDLEAEDFLDVYGIPADRELRLMMDPAACGRLLLHAQREAQRLAKRAELRGRQRSHMVCQACLHCRVERGDARGFDERSGHATPVPEGQDRQ